MEIKDKCSSYKDKDVGGGGESREQICQIWMQMTIST